MKKLMVMVGGLCALAALAYVGRLWAQNPGQVAPQAQNLRTRIGLINLTYVMKNYEKFKTFQEEMKTAFNPFQEKDRNMQKELEILAHERQDPKTDPQKAEQLEMQMKRLQRDLQDNKENAKSMLSKRADEQMKILYMDVMDAATRYARGHEFDLVLHYNDATTERDYYSPQNIARKLSSGACMPLYAAAGMDISKAVVDMLNAASPSHPAGPGREGPAGSN